MYVLAEMLMDDTTKDVILATIRDRIKDSRYEHYIPEPSAICTIYEGTPETSPARRLMVEMRTQRAAKEGIEDWSTENLPKDFLLDLSVSLIAERPLPNHDNQFQAKWSAERDFPITKKEPYRSMYPPADKSLPREKAKKIPDDDGAPRPKAKKKPKKRVANDDESSIDYYIPRKKIKKPARRVVDDDDLLMDELFLDDDLAFLDEWSLRSDGNSGNTKTKVTLGPLHDTAASNNERITDWEAKVRKTGIIEQFVQESSRT